MKYALLFLLLCGVATPAFAQDSSAADSPVARGTLSGRVVEKATQEPLIGATVRIVGTAFGAATDTEGNFTIKNIPVATYRISVSAVGYESATKTDITLNPARPVTLKIELAESSVDSKDEVVVTADYFQKSGDAVVSEQKFSYEEIRRLPGGFEDVVRTISTLPGVAQAQNGRNDLLVRGGAPSENLFLIDNIESPNINHFGTQGAGGGPLSFVNLDFVEGTTFSTGGFGVRYGDRISSVLGIDLRNGREDRQGGKATISASQFGLNLEGPVLGNGQYLFSARRSYLDFIFKAAGFSFVPEYWDFLGKASYNLGGGNSVSLLAIAALDNTRQFNDDADDRFDNSRLLSNTQNQLVAGITWKRVFKGGFFNLTLGRTLVDYKFQQNDSLLSPVFRNNSREDEFNLRLDVLYQLSRETEFTLGGGAKTTGFSSDIALKATNLDVSFSDRFYKGALYAQVSQQFLNRLRVNLGGRVDYFSGIDTKFYPAMRASASLSLDPQTNLNASAGQYFQAPSYIWLVANAQNRNLKEISTQVAVAGIDRAVTKDVKVSLEAYYKRYTDYPASLSRTYLVLANTGAGFGGSDDGFAAFGLDPLASLGQGEARGVELFVQKKLSDLKFYGVLSISVNESRFTAIDGVSRPSNFDQRVIANLSGGYQFSDQWEAGIKFRFATGRPYTPVAGASTGGDPTSGYQVTSQFNALRLEATHSLDVRVDKRWPFANWNLITYIDIQNIYNRQNPDPPEWSERLQQGEVRTGLGLLPTIGINAEF